MSLSALTMQPLPLFTCFFFNDTATTEIYTLSLHDALPIYADRRREIPVGGLGAGDCQRARGRLHQADLRARDAPQDRKSTRLNSSHSQISHAVFCLLKNTKWSTFLIKEHLR